MNVHEFSPKLPLVFAAVAVLMTLVAGCATTPPDAKFTHALTAEHRVDTNDTVTVNVQAAQNVTVIDLEKQRLAQKIKAKIDEHKMTNATGGDQKEYHLEVLLTRYDKGNAFARAMLAGLGQIHVDARVAVFALPQKTRLADFTVNKTFAWGGIYGASQSIEDVEEGFADGVAEAVTKPEQ